MALIGPAALLWPAAGSADPFGALTQLPGRQGCVRDGGGLGCARARGIGVTSSVTVSPEGRNVYAAGVGVGVFVRDQGSGALAQLGGRDSCVNSDGTEGCARARGVEVPEDVTVTPDGRNVYVASDSWLSRAGGAVGVFARDQASGALRQLGGREGCVSSRGRGGCAGGRALGEPMSVAVSADGRNVYVASSRSNGVAVFARDELTGQLRQLSGRTGCVSWRGRGGCARGRGLSGAQSVVVSRDGRNVYVASAGSFGIAVFARDPATGALRQLRGQAGCVLTARELGCARGRAVGVTWDVTVSPDGHNVYAVGWPAGAIAVFARNETTGSLHQLAGRQGCTNDDGSEGCTRGRVVDEPSSVRVSPDGGNLYVAFGNGVADGALAVFARDQQTGNLHQLPARAGCLRPHGRGGCSSARALESATALAIPLDGRNVYAASVTGPDLTDGAVAVFARSPG